MLALVAFCTYKQATHKRKCQQINQTQDSLSLWMSSEEVCALGTVLLCELWVVISCTLRVSTTTLGQFQSGVKTVLFRLAYGTWLGAFVIVYAVRLAPYKYSYWLTYLLTHFIISADWHKLKVHPYRVATQNWQKFIISCLSASVHTGCPSTTADIVVQWYTYPTMSAVTIRVELTLAVYYRSKQWLNKLLQLSTNRCWPIVTR